MMTIDRNLLILSTDKNIFHGMCQLHDGLNIRKTRSPLDGMRHTHHGFQTLGRTKPLFHFQQVLCQYLYSPLQFFRPASASEEQSEPQSGDIQKALSEESSKDSANTPIADTPEAQESVELEPVMKTEVH
jgi:hypothetical protein